MTSQHFPTYEVNAAGPTSRLSLSELWSYRELLYFLTWRDIKLRYKQTVIGVAWAVIQPVITMVVFSVFFGGMAKLDSNGIPYPIFSFAALVPWTFFSNGLGMASDSLIGNAHLIRKMYFPRLLLPIARILGGGVDFVIAFVVLLVMMLGYGYLPTFASLIFIPALTILMMATTLGISLWFSALNVRYRDVRFVVPFLIQIWMFVTPVVYSSTIVTEPAHTLYSFNPMTSVVEGFRLALLGRGDLSPAMLFISVVTALVVLGSGLIYFQRAEGMFADVV